MAGHRPGNIVAEKFIVLDTDLFSFLVKGDRRIEPYQRLLQRATLCLSFQTVAELYQWAELRNRGVQRRAALDSHLHSYVILPYDVDTGRAWARVRVECQRRGRPISPQDAWIAACALWHDCSLATHNVADFSHISSLSLITPGR